MLARAYGGAFFPWSPFPMAKERKEVFRRGKRIHHKEQRYRRDGKEIEEEMRG